jgi:hypothetical protein
LVILVIVIGNLLQLCYRQSFYDDDDDELELELEFGSSRTTGRRTNDIASLIGS